MGILSVREVSKFYNNHTALKEVSIEIEAGTTFGLLGPNGAGKTSLIRIINQITAPDKGQVLFNDAPLSKNHIAKIGYLPEERGLYSKMKVGEQLIYLARLKGLSKADANQRIKEWLVRFEADSWWNKSIEELSKGMAQKIQFIATVIHQPELLIFDEPFTGFDPINTNLIKSEIIRLRDQGATIIFSTHRMDSVEEICDEIALINKGEKILDGKLKDIKDDYKSNIYEVQLSIGQNPLNLTNATIIGEKSEDDLLTMRLQSHTEDSNALASELMQYGRLLSFKEELPSLNDIFIQKVQN